MVVSNFQCSHACSVVSFASKRRASDVCVISLSFSNPMVCAPSAWVSTPCANDGFGYSPDARALYKGIDSTRVRLLVSMIKVTLRRYINM